MSKTPKRLVSEFAQVQDTHSDKLKSIRTKNQYFHIKQSTSHDPEIVVTINDNMDYFATSKKMDYKKSLIISENQYIFDQNQEDWDYYLSKHDVEYADQYILCGAGSAITRRSPAMYRFLSKFQNIMYFGDLDDHGYLMYQLLRSHLSTSIDFILPSTQIIRKHDEHIALTKDPQWIDPEKDLLKFINERKQLKLKKFAVIYQELMVRF